MGISLLRHRRLLLAQCNMQNVSLPWHEKKKGRAVSLGYLLVIYKSCVPEAQSRVVAWTSILLVEHAHCPRMRTRNADHIIAEMAVTTLE